MVELGAAAVHTGMGKGSGGGLYRGVVGIVVFDEHGRVLWGDASRGRVSVEQTEAYTEGNQECGYTEDFYSTPLQCGSDLRNLGENLEA